ncbi:MAG: ankyrin repeat domain-containing protein [Coxiellaceae bacterium]|nr:ankyrin repeat domain-containing protein [Coxiellaceae bacterium]
MRRRKGNPGKGWQELVESDDEGIEMPGVSGDEGYYPNPLCGGVDDDSAQNCMMYSDVPVVPAGDGSPDKDDVDGVVTTGVAEYKAPDGFEQTIIRNTATSTGGVPIPPAIWLKIGAYLDPISAARLLLQTSKLITAPQEKSIHRQLQMQMFPDQARFLIDWHAYRNPTTEMVNFAYERDSMVNFAYGRYSSKRANMKFYMRTGQFDKFFECFQPQARSLFSLFGRNKRHQVTINDLFGDPIQNGFHCFNQIAKVQPDWLPAIYEKIVRPYFYDETNPNNPDVRKVDGHGLNITIWACACGDVETVNCILTRYPATTQKEFKNMMSFAIGGGRTEMVAFLLNYLEYDEPDQQGYNLLTNACHYGYLEIVRLLIDKFNYDAYTRAMESTVIEGHAGVMSLLLEQPTAAADKAVTHKTDLLVIAIRFNFTSIARMLLKRLRATSVNARDSLFHDETALYTAVYHNNEAMVELLLKHKEIDPNVMSRPIGRYKDTSPIEAAVTAGFTKIAEMLLKRPDLDLNAESPDDYELKKQSLLEQAGNYKHILEYKRPESPITRLIEVLKKSQDSSESTQFEYLRTAFKAAIHRRCVDELIKLSDPIVEPLLTEANVSKLESLAKFYRCDKAVVILARLTRDPEASKRCTIC